MKKNWLILVGFWTIQMILCAMAHTIIGDICGIFGAIGWVFSLYKLYMAPND